MKLVETGKGRITLLTLIAIWSISLVVDLPGLAITPVMSRLDTIFPDASHLEIQLLSVLPNFCVIPMIWLSGLLSTSKSKLMLINLGMTLFLISGAACFFARSMPALIIISCFIGIGCGLVIPLAAGVIADFFTGVQRVRQMGIKSGIANFTLIFATFIVGWMGASDWHLPFMVYLVPVIPLLLSPFLSHKYIARTASPSELAPTAPIPGGIAVAGKPVQKQSAPLKATPLQRARATEKSRIMCIAGIMTFYLIITVCTITITYYLPFLMQDYGMPDSDTSVVTAVFFLMITAAGLLLPYVLKSLTNYVTPVCMLMMIVGLVLASIFHTFILYLIACILTGLGYGLLQPIFYTKASLLSPTSGQATKTISYVMMANYFGTAITPLFFTGLQDLLHIHGHTFAFWLGAAMMTVMLVFALLRRDSYVFYTSLRDE